MNVTWIVVSLGIGLLMGAFYFGGLWLTVRKVANTRPAGLILFGSFLVRAAVVLIGFYFVTDGKWERVLACMTGFVLARTLFIHRLRRVGADAGRPESLTATRVTG